MDTDADFEELNKAPPVPDDCMKCGVRSASIERCATCKNAFYCGAACQKKAWREHKLECSPLPIGQMAYPANMDPVEYRELDEHVRRIAVVIGKWTNEQVELRDDVSTVIESPATELIRDITLPTTYSSESYAASIPGEALRTHIIRIIRLFAVHWVASLNKDAALSLTQVRQSLDSPLGSFTVNQHGLLKRLWLPKIFCRPMELSIAEYVRLPRLMWIVNMQGGNNAMGDLRPGMSDAESAYEMRYISLMSLASGYFNS